jgi:alpha-glucosidase (family GH31 glycosyl hydrolase)
MKNGWTGWTFDKQLFPYPEDTLGYLKSRGLLLAANLHDAQGVGNWDRQYSPLSAFTGDKNSTIAFASCVNQKYAYGLEDIVLGALNKQGMDFWWIDWQQGTSENIDSSRLVGF